MNIYLSEKEFLKAEIKRPQNCGTGYCSCIECVMAPAPVQSNIKSYLEKDNSAQPAVPDAIHHTDTSESLEYIQGWNDCRSLMLKSYTLK